MNKLKIFVIYGSWNSEMNAKPEKENAIRFYNM